MKISHYYYNIDCISDRDLQYLLDWVVDSIKNTYILDKSVFIPIFAKLLNEKLKRAEI